MTRFLCLSIVGLVTLSLCASDISSAVGQEVKTGQLRIARPAQSGEQPRGVVVQSLGQGGYSFGGAYSAANYYWQLQRPDVQEELELVAEQKEKLKAIAQQYAEQSRADYAGWRDLSQEDRQKKMAEIRKKSQQRMEQRRKQIEDVLLPHQLGWLKDISFRNRAAGALASPAMLKRLGLSEEQQKKILDNRTQMLEKIRKLQKKTLDDAMKILTKEQLKKLKEIYGAGS